MQKQGAPGKLCNDKRWVDIAVPELAVTSGEMITVQHNSNLTFSTVGEVSERMNSAVRSLVGTRMISLNAISLVFQNHKFCKIRPNFLPIMHFLQESYEFVRKTQILQICYSVEHFLQESDNIFAKFASICKKFLQKMRCVTSTKNSFKIFWTHFVFFLNNT